MSANPNQMNLTTDVSFDSDLDEEINDLLMLVPQSTDDGGNDDLEDTAESSSSSIVQCDSEPMSALTPLHAQSLLLQVPAGLRQCRVEQIILQKGGTSLCLLLQWKRDDPKKVSQLGVNLIKVSFMRVNLKGIFQGEREIECFPIDVIQIELFMGV